MKQFQVFFYFGARPARGSKAEPATLTLTDQGIEVGGNRIPFLAMASCEVKKLDGIGTVVRIESEMQTLTTAVYRWLLFGNRLVVINLIATKRLAASVNQGLNAFRDSRR